MIIKKLRSLIIKEISPITESTNNSARYFIKFLFKLLLLLIIALAHNHELKRFVDLHI